MATVMPAPITIALLLALGLGAAPTRAAQPPLMILLREPTQADWDRLAASKIYFGHNSVGGNILHGLELLRAASPGIVPRVREIPATGPLTEVGLSHGPIGENTQPLTKLRDFERIMSVGVGASADWAMFKFCYVDMETGGDPDGLFARYRQSMVELRKAWPAAVIHVTMPLTSPQTGPKAWAKSLLGQSPRGYADNALRQRYNDLLRAEYVGREPIFDLAALESSRPDGSRILVDHEGRGVEALNPDFTDDGGHLNDAGARFVAGQFLHFLAELSRREPLL